MSILSVDNIRPAKGSSKSKVRKGRGASSGKGRSCGRGRGGSGHRSGLSDKASFEGGQMPLARRLPKRGFSNQPFKDEIQLVSLKQLQDKFSSGDKVNRETLIKKGVIKSKASNRIKILANGEVKKKLTVSGCELSARAREQILNAGGNIDA